MIYVDIERAINCLYKDIYYVIVECDDVINNIIVIVIINVKNNLI